MWGYNEKTKEDNYQLYEFMLNDVMTPEISMRAKVNDKDNSIKSISINVKQQLSEAKIKSAYYYLEKKNEKSSYKEPSQEELENKKVEFVDTPKINCFHNVEINPEITGEGYYDLTVYAINENNSYTVNYLSNIEVFKGPEISYKIEGEKEGETSSIAINDYKEVYLNVKGRDKDDEVTVKYFYSNVDYTENGTKLLDKSLFENNKDVESFTIYGENSEDKEITILTFKDENVYLYVQATDSYGNSRFLRTGSLRQFRIRRLESIYIDNEQINEEERDFTKNKPEFYGTVEATIRVGDEFDIKNSYYRILAKDFEDGNLTKNIVVINNNVDTSKPGTYYVDYVVNDSDENFATIHVPIHVVDDPNANIKIKRKLYDFCDYQDIINSMATTGFNRGNKQDSQNLGIYLKNGASMKINIESSLNEILYFNVLNNDTNTEAKMISLNQNEYNVEMQNGKVIIKNNGVIVNRQEQETEEEEENEIDEGNFEQDITTEKGKDQVILDGVPFINTPKKTKDVVVEIEMINGVEPLDYYTYGDLEINEEGKEVNPDFKNLNNKLLLLDGTRVSILVPECDFEDLGKAYSNINSEKYPNDTFNTFEELLQFYDNLIETYDDWIGLSYNDEEVENANLKTKYLLKANKSGTGYAYYGSNEVGFNSGTLGPLIHPHSTAWTILHEIGHGYQGKFARKDLYLGEVSNNFLAYYFLKENLVGNGIDGKGYLEQATQALENNQFNLQTMKSGNALMWQLCVYLNLFNKTDHVKAIQDMYKYYRKLETDKNVDTNSISTLDIIAKSVSDSSKYNVIPYFQRWKAEPSLDIIREINEKDYPIVYPIRDLVSTDEQAETIKNDLGQEGIYSLATNDELKKYNLKGNVTINIDNNIFDKIKNNDIVIKSGTETVKSINIKEKKYSFELPIGVYEIECKNGIEITCEYLVVKQNENNEINIEENIVNSIKLFKAPNKALYMSYIVGEKLDLSGGVLLVNTTKGNYTIDLIDPEIQIETNFDSSKVGMYNMTIKYREKTIEIKQIFVAKYGTYYEDNKKDKGIYIQKEPSKTQYKVGEDLDISDGSILYVNEERNQSGKMNISGFVVGLDDPDIQITGYDKNTIGNQNIKITYYNYETYLNINVVPEDKASETNKIKYEIGDEIKITAQFTQNIRSKDNFHDLYIKIGDGEEIKQDSYEIIGNKVIYHYIVTAEFGCGDIHVTRFGENKNANNDGDRYIGIYTESIQENLMNQIIKDEIEGKYYVEAEEKKMETLEIAITTNKETKIYEDNDCKYIKDFSRVQIIGEYNTKIDADVSLIISKGNTENIKIDNFNANRIIKNEKSFDIIDVTRYLNDHWEGELVVKPIIKYRKNKEDNIDLSNYNIVYTIDGVVIDTDDAKVLFDNAVYCPEMYVKKDKFEERVEENGSFPAGTVFTAFAEFDRIENYADYTGIKTIKLKVYNMTPTGNLVITNRNGELITANHSNEYSIEELPLQIKADNIGKYKISMEKEDNIGNKETKIFEITISNNIKINRNKSGVNHLTNDICRIEESDEKYILSFELENITPDDITVYVDKNKTIAEYLGKETDQTDNIQYEKYAFDLTRGGKHTINIENKNGERLFYDIINVNTVYFISDINADGYVDGVDLVCLLKYLANLETYEEYNIDYTGDLDGDNQVNIMDAVLLARIITEDTQIIRTSDGHFTVRKSES